METTIMGFIGLYLGYLGVIYWDNGKENGNYYNGFYRAIFGLFRGYLLG